MPEIDKITALTRLYHKTNTKLLIMAALCNRAGHYIFCPVVSSRFFFFFLA